ncbi:sulfate/thiosulfate ABC transporter permease CysW, partial [Acinetobacter baumannii]
FSAAFAVSSLLAFLALLTLILKTWLELHQDKPEPHSTDS